MCPQKVLAFDLYGTLLDTASIAEELKSHFPENEQEKAITVVREWRKYQLEYTWRLNSMMAYEPFDIVTRKSLLHALHENSASLSEPAIDSLMLCYDKLDPFPDVDLLLASLFFLEDTRSIVFSNGTGAMLEAALASSHLKDAQFQYVTVDDTKRYKPSRKTYHHLAEKVGKSIHEVNDIYLVSGNAFDVVGAVDAGLKAIWVDREGKGWGDGLGGPTFVVRSLAEVVDVVRADAEIEE